MHRRLILLEGTTDDTDREARAIVAALRADSVLWAGGDDVPARQVRQLLGRSFSACVVSLHDRFDADLLAQCQGFVAGGGALIVRVGLEQPVDGGLVAFGFDDGDVTAHFVDRVRRVLRAHHSGVEPLPDRTHDPGGTPDQRRAVEALVSFASTRDLAVLTASRGRGKSTALGLALRQIPGRIAVTAQHRDAVREVFAFAPPDPRIRFVSPLELLKSEQFDLILVDEAAQLPVALLQELTERFARTPIVFATTTHGYEGTGRGFALRFVEQLRSGSRPLVELTLATPIRWDADDPVESAIFDALLLDAEPFTPAAVTDLTHREVTRRELASNEVLLREVFGLLVHAHYRTTPGDLYRLLDAPNLAVHASFADGHVVAATLVAREGSIPADVASELAMGRHRLVGHALPETFAAHLGRADAAELSMVRSVRIAVHPAARRHGVASALVEHVHAAYDADLFGTLFGATPELLEFRRSLGYELVRLSASLGRGTGVPSVAMVRPVSAAARALVDSLRADLARDLPIQLELHAADESLSLSHALEAGLMAGLGPPSPLTPDERVEIVRSYAYGPRTFESAALAVAEFVERGSLDALDPTLRTLVQRRALERRSWRVAAADAGLPSVAAAMRALRRAIREIYET